MDQRSPNKPRRQLPEVHRTPAQTTATLQRRVISLEHEVAELRARCAAYEQRPPKSAKSTPSRSTSPSQAALTPPLSARSAAAHQPLAGTGAGGGASRLKVRGTRVEGELAHQMLDPKKKPDTLDDIAQASHSWPAVPCTWFEVNDVSADAGFTSHAVTVRICPKPFGHGAFRTCHYLAHTDNGVTELYVVKCATDTAANPPATAQHACFADVRMQHEAGLIAAQYNQRAPPKEVQFLPAAVAYFPEPALFPPELDRLAKQQYTAVEPLVPGSYIKWSNNLDYVSPLGHMTPLAFSHFSFEATKGAYMICDIQGVEGSGDTGYFFTDPQIHGTVHRWGVGDLGREGIRLFFSAHRCNTVCELLGLKPSNTTSADVEPNSDGETAVVAAVKRAMVSAGGGDGGSRSPSRSVSRASSAARRDEGRSSTKRQVDVDNDDIQRAFAEVWTDVAHVAERAGQGAYSVSVLEADGDEDRARAQSDAIMRAHTEVSDGQIHRHSRFLWGRNAVVNVAQQASVWPATSTIQVEANLPEYEDDVLVELREGRSDVDLGVEECMLALCPGGLSCVAVVRKQARGGKGLLSPAPYIELIPHDQDDGTVDDRAMSGVLDAPAFAHLLEADPTVASAVDVQVVAGRLFVIVASTAPPDESDDGGDPRKVPIVAAVLYSRRLCRPLPSSDAAAAADEEFEKITKITTSRPDDTWMQGSLALRTDGLSLFVSAQSTAAARQLTVLQLQPLTSDADGAMQLIRAFEVPSGGFGDTPTWCCGHSLCISSDSTSVAHVLRLQLVPTAVPAPWSGRLHGDKPVRRRAHERWGGPVRPWSKLCSIATSDPYLVYCGYSTGEIVIWCALSATVLRFVPSPAMDPAVRLLGCSGWDVYAAYSNAAIVDWDTSGSPPVARRRFEVPMAEPTALVGTANGVFVACDDGAVFVAHRLR